MFTKMIARWRALLFFLGLLITPISLILTVTYAPHFGWILFIWLASAAVSIPLLTEERNRP